MNILKWPIANPVAPWPEIESSQRSLDSYLATQPSDDPVIAGTRRELAAFFQRPSGLRGVVLLDRRSGFFSHALIGLAFSIWADKHHLPLTFWHRPGSLYARPQQSDEENGWLQFFQAPVDAPELPAETTGAALTASARSGCLYGEGLWVTQENLPGMLPPGGVEPCSRSYLGQLFARLFRPQLSIAMEVDDFIARHFAGKPILGVHMRGNEHDGELALYRRGRLPLPRVFSAVDGRLADLGAERIFLATDQIDICSAFKARYGSRLVTYDAQRCLPGESLHLDLGGLSVGRDVLMECLLLARTSFLLHGISNVALAACYFSPELRHENLYDRYALYSRLEFELGRARFGARVCKAWLWSRLGL